MEIESRVEVERRREKEMAEFLPLKIVERRMIVAALRLVCCTHYPAILPQPWKQSSI
jgi:hypothetical protein